MHYSKEKPSCSTFRVITTNFWVPEYLGNFTVVLPGKISTICKILEYIVCHFHYQKSPTTALSLPEMYAQRRGSVLPVRQFVRTGSVSVKQLISTRMMPVIPVSIAVGLVIYSNQLF